MKSKSPNAENARRSPAKRITLLVLVLVCAGALVYTIAAASQSEGGLLDRSGPAVAASRLATVTRGKMTISLLVPGTIQTERSITITNQVEGQSKIIWLVDEGTMVKKGDKLVELESSGLDDKIYQQRTSLMQTEAKFNSAQQDLEMQKQENESNLLTAENRVALAELNLQKYEEGSYQQNLMNRNSDITIANEELERAKDQLTWTQKLVEKGYVSTGELQSDSLSVKKQELAVQKAENALDVYEQFEHKAELLQLNNDLREAKANLARVGQDNTYKLRSREIAVESASAETEHERSRLAELEAQQDACVINAPEDGMVVYATQRGGRGFSQATMELGADVSNRQRLIDLPDFSSWRVEARVHESMIRQVSVGQRVLVTVDAFAGSKLFGTVTKVAVMPQQSDFRGGSDIKEYEVDVRLDDDTSISLKPGMTSKNEIVLAEIDDALQIPMQAVAADGDETYVMAMVDGKPVHRTVKVGRASDTAVQVLDGLTEGEQIVLGTTGAGNLNSVIQRPSETLNQSERDQLRNTVPAEPGGPGGFIPQEGQMPPDMNGADMQSMRGRFGGRAGRGGGGGGQGFGGRGGGGGSQGFGGRGGGGGGQGFGGRAGGGGNFGGDAGGAQE